MYTRDKGFSRKSPRIKISFIPNCQLLVQNTFTYLGKERRSHMKIRIMKSFLIVILSLTYFPYVKIIYYSLRLFGMYGTHLNMTFI